MHAAFAPELVPVLVRVEAGVAEDGCRGPSCRAGTRGGKLISVASGSSSATSPWWVKARLTVLSGFLLPELAGGDERQQAREQGAPFSGLVKSQEQVAGEGHVISAEGEALDVSWR